MTSNIINTIDISRRPMFAEFNLKETTMNTFTNLNEAPTRELTPEEQALLASKVLFVTTDEGDEHAEELAAETVLSAEKAPTLH